MTVLFLSERAHTGVGGIENHIKNLAFHLISHKIIVHYLSADKLSKMSLLGKRVVFASMIHERLHAVQPDIVHVHGFSSFFVYQCLTEAKKVLPQVKLVYTPHYHPFIYHRHPFLAKAFFYVFLKRSLRNVDSMVALTEAEKSFFSEFISREKIAVIPNGIVIRTDILKKEKPQKHTILFVGRDDHNKRLDFLLRQKEYFAQNEVSCIVVTDKPHISDDVFTYYTNIESSVLEILYKNATLLVVPSKYEAFSIVALEAMQYGTPVVISDRVQIKYYLMQMETFSEVFVYDDIKSFQEKIEGIFSLSSNEYMERSKYNISFAKKFDWASVFSKTLAIYKEKDSGL